MESKLIETKLLFLDDSYQKEFKATIMSVSIVENSEKTGQVAGQAYIVLDQTLFYPRGGGQPSDTGILECNDITYAVIEVVKKDGLVLHKLDMRSTDDLQDKDAAHNKPELKPGDVVTGKIDWNRRYALMRMHTAAHLIDAVLYRDGKILATGNELGADKSRIDFNMPEFTLDKVQEYIAQANEIISQDLPVKNYYLSRDEAFKIPGIVKLAFVLPPDIPVLRITEIVGLDVQADGGTHVKSLKEIGKISIISIENKGKERKRICYKLDG